MKRKIIGIAAAFFILLGAGLLIIPRVSNYIGVQIAHTTVNDFLNLKENIVEGDKPSNEPTPDMTKEARKSENLLDIPKNKDEVESNVVLYRVDIDRLLADSIAYNEMLKNNQQNLLIDELSYQSPSLNLWNYGIPNGVYGYVSASTIGMELPIYLGASDYNMAYGAAHLTYTSLPIGGKNTNAVLSGHSGFIGRIFFDYIRNLNQGDEVVIENYWDKLTYTVIDTKICKSYQSSDCYLSEGKDLLTMLTCISDGQGGFDRYYVICERE